jgi:hypothetical protein
VSSDSHDDHDDHDDSGEKTEMGCHFHAGVESVHSQGAPLHFRLPPY